MSTQTLRPPHTGVYPVLDAALFIRATTPLNSNAIRLSTRHIHRWVNEGLAGGYLDGLRGRDVALTFLDLVTMRMVAIFRSYGIKPRDIRFAHETLRINRGSTHPFAMEPIWVSGPDIYIKEQGYHVAVTKNWQAAFEFISEYLRPTHNLIFDEDEQAIGWEPEIGILLDPRKSFGSPCIKGTRISTETLWALFSAGDATDLIAAAYGLSKKQVEAAIAWEEKLENLAA